MKRSFDARFAAVVTHFAEDRAVSVGEGKGFGTGALKVKGKIFAMVASKGRFVVKLPKQRVTELVAAKRGVPFDPGHGRLMKEWLVVTAPRANWIALAEEAAAFVKSGKAVTAFCRVANT